MGGGGGRGEVEVISYAALLKRIYVCITNMDSICICKLKGIRD